MYIIFDSVYTNLHGQQASVINPSVSINMVCKNKSNQGHVGGQGRGVDGRTVVLIHRLFLPLTKFSYS